MDLCQVLGDILWLCQDITGRWVRSNICHPVVAEFGRSGVMLGSALGGQDQRKFNPREIVLTDTQRHYDPSMLQVDDT